MPAQGWLRWLVALPSLWVLVEWIRGWFLSGFPWLALGYSQLATPLRGYAPLLGVYGVSLAVASYCRGAGRAGARPPRGSDRRRGAVERLWSAGFALARDEWTQPAGRPLSVALVQGAVPQSMKWVEGQRERTMQLYWDLT